MSFESFTIRIRKSSQDTIEAPNLEHTIPAEKFPYKDGESRSREVIFKILTEEALAAGLLTNAFIQLYGASRLVLIKNSTRRDKSTGRDEKQELLITNNANLKSLEDQKLGQRFLAVCQILIDEHKDKPQE